MDIQQIVALMIVAVAFVFLARQLFASVRSILENKSGCGGGCGKCAFANLEKPNQRQRPTRPDVIALGDIRTLPRKTEK